MKSEAPLVLSSSEQGTTPEIESRAGFGFPVGPNPILDERSSRQAEERAQQYKREKKRQTLDLADNHPDPLLTVGEFADQLRVSRACIRKWILTRKVGVVKIGRLVRLRSSELRRIIDDGSRPPSQSQQK
jgi:excisionase family DNA binding protein